MLCVEILIQRQKHVCRKTDSVVEVNKKIQ
jgi:hypothetical protein